LNFDRDMPSVPLSGARYKLLETATRLFAAKGYAGTSVREIVDQAGVSKPVLYYYFENKAGLFRAILDGAAEVQQRVLDEAVRKTGSTQARLAYLFRRIYEGVQEHKLLFQLIHKLLFGPPRGAPGYDIARFYRAMIAAVEKIYREGLSAGEVSDADPEEAAWLVLSLIDFCLNLEQVSPELTDARRPERLLELAFQGLKA
jgi:AcrR family transcriptional regulator